MGLVDSLNDAVNKGISGTERLLEIGKLKTQMGGFEKARNELLTALGAVAYQQYRASSGAVEAFSPLGDMIRAVEIDIAQTQTRLTELESGLSAHKTPCPSCGSLNLREARFCVKCGAAMVVPAVQVKCESCGAELPEGGHFCVLCGAASESQSSGTGGASNKDEEPS